jgi:hypothetical protein
VVDVAPGSQRCDRTLRLTDCVGIDQRVVDDLKKRVDVFEYQGTLQRVELDGERSGESSDSDGLFDGIQGPSQTL